MTKAGWATGDITPPLGLPMGGRGMRFSYGTKVLSPLEAAVTVLEDGAGCRAALVSADIVSMGGVQNNALRLAIASAIGASPDAIIINTSHTHSGPMMSYERFASLHAKPPELEAYERELSEKILRLALAAAQNLQPVRVFWRDGESNIGINRRQYSRRRCSHVAQSRWLLSSPAMDAGFAIAFHGSALRTFFARLSSGDRVQLRMDGDLFHVAGAQSRNPQS